VRAKWKGFAVVFARVEGGLAVVLWEGCWRREEDGEKKSKMSQGILQGGKKNRRNQNGVLE
jgi:hypothetical protein